MQLRSIHTKSPGKLRFPTDEVLDFLQPSALGVLPLCLVWHISTLWSFHELGAPICTPNIGLFAGTLPKRAKWTSIFRSPEVLVVSMVRLMVLG